MKYEYVSSSTLPGTKDDARVAENAGVVNIISYSYDDSGSSEYVKISNISSYREAKTTEYNVQVEESRRDEM